MSIEIYSLFKMDFGLQREKLEPRLSFKWGHFYDANYIHSDLFCVGILPPSLKKIVRLFLNNKNSHRFKYHAVPNKILTSKHILWLLEVAVITGFFMICFCAGGQNPLS